MIFSTNAKRIIRKFGNPYRLSEVLSKTGVAEYGRTARSIYYWTQDTKKGGSGGAIPYKCREAVEAAARLEGIHLTDEDWKI